jgi:hypothetical protein
VGVTSIACSVALIAATEGLAKFDFTRTSFTDGTVDCFLISVFQIMIFPLVAHLAIKSASSYSATAIAEGSAEADQCCCFRCFYSTPRHSYDRVSLDRSAAGNQNPLSRQHSATLEGYEDEERRRLADNKKMDDTLLDGRKSMDRLVSIYLFVVFLLSTGVQVYIGLKCISFNFRDEGRQGALMGLEVLWVNILAWTLKEIIQKCTREDGLLVPSLHPHRLHLYSALAGHWCDLCGQRIAAGSAFRCKLCDYDLCMDCYSKRDKFTLEGQIRGDKGQYIYPS